jgi:hypothetical protein
MSSNLRIVPWTGNVCNWLLAMVKADLCCVLRNSRISLTMHKTKIAMLAALSLSVPVSARIPPERLLELSRGLAQTLIGLSPAGADIYARRMVASAEDNQQFEAGSRLKVLLGEELAREAPNRLRLAKLSEAIAREKANISRGESKHLIATAFQLSETDRRKLGEVIARNNGTAPGTP